MSNIFNFFDRKKLVQEQQFSNQLFEIQEKLGKEHRRIFGKKKYLIQSNGVIVRLFIISIAVYTTKCIFPGFENLDRLWKISIILFVVSICLVSTFLLFGLLTKDGEKRYKIFRDAYIKQVVEYAESESVRDLGDKIMLEILISYWLRSRYQL